MLWGSEAEHCYVSSEMRTESQHLLICLLASCCLPPFASAPAFRDCALAKPTILPTRLPAMKKKKKKKHPPRPCFDPGWHKTTQHAPSPVSGAESPSLPRANPAHRQSSAYPGPRNKSLNFRFLPQRHRRTRVSDGSELIATTRGFRDRADRHVIYRYHTHSSVQAPSLFALG